jgi:hypothetical protein
MISQEELQSFVLAKNSRPHDRLGMHRWDKNGKKKVVVRAFLADAQQCFVSNVAIKKKYPMEKLDPWGFFRNCN